MALPLHFEEIDCNDSTFEGLDENNIDEMNSFLSVFLDNADERADSHGVSTMAAAKVRAQRTTEGGSDKFRNRIFSNVFSIK